MEGRKTDSTSRLPRRSGDLPAGAQSARAHAATAEAVKADSAEQRLPGRSGDPGEERMPEEAGYGYGV